MNFGNGDELGQIYAAGAGKDPALVTGSWDVVFALPTNASVGSLSSGTGNAWTHPHASNGLYTSTTNTGGFLMNGTYTTDGWTDQGTPTSVGALATGEKIYSGGYKWTNDAADEGIKYTKSSLTAGQNYVIRAVAHSDTTSIPKVQIWDGTNGAEITQMTGVNTSTRTVPNVFIFTFELPTIARYGSVSDCTSIEVRLLNTQASGTVYWHQVELLTNLIDNPSVEVGSGDVGGSPTPWIPSGWSNQGLDDGEGVREGTSVHSGLYASKHNLADLVEGIKTSFSVTAGRFYSFGAWAYGSGQRVTTLYGRQVFHQATAGGVMWDTMPVGSYSLMKAVLRDDTSGTAAPNFEAWNNDQTAYVDDVYAFELTGISLTATPTTEGDSLETTGLRVDGKDTLSQPITGLSTTSGTIRFKITPRHSASVSTSFGEASPIIFDTNGSTDRMWLYFANSTTFRIVGMFNSTQVYADWASPTLNAGTTYTIEVSYASTGNLVVKVDGVQRASAAMGGAAFSSVPTTIYFGTNNAGNGVYDCTISNFVSSTPTETTTMPFYKFGSKSVKLDLAAGAMADEYVTNINVGNTNSHTLSAYVYNGTSGAVGGTVDATVAKLVFNGSAQTTTYTDMGGGWWRLTYTAAAGSGAQNYGVQVQAAKIVYVDGVQLEEKAYATTYTDGTLGTGYAWTGTEHNSTSTRTAGALQYVGTDNINKDEGSVSFWVKPVGWGWGDSRGKRVNLFNSGIPWAWQPGIAIVQESGYLRFYATWNGYNQLRSGVLSGSGWLHVVGDWSVSSGLRHLYINGVGVSGNYGSQTFTTTINVGGQSGIAGAAEAVISDFRIYGSALSAAQVTDLYNIGLVSHQNAAEENDKYEATGTYTTPVLDLGNVTDWSAADDFTTTDTLNGGTIAYQTATSANGADWDGWESLSGAEIQSTPRRYLKVKGTFEPSGDQDQTPVLSGLEVNYIPDAVPPTNPSVLTVSPGVSGDWFNDSTPSFSWPRAEQLGGASDSGEGASGVKGYHVYLGPSDSAVPFNTVTNKWFVDDPDLGDVEFTLPVELTEAGVYYLRIQAEDNAGNYPGNDPEDTWAAFEYNYESVIPEKPLYITVNPSGYSRDNQYTFTWPAGTDEESGVWGYCYNAGPGDQTCETKEALLVGENYEKYLEDVAYQAGGNVFYVRTRDNAGNLSDPTQVTFYWNSNAPSEPLSVTATPSAECVGSPDNCWVFSWSPPLEYTEEIVRYYYSVNGMPTIDSPTVEGAFPETPAFAAGTRQGTNTFYVVAEDVVAVNFGVAGFVEFSVNSAAPAIPDNLQLIDSSNRDEEDWALTSKWSEPAEVGSGIDHYNVYKSEDGVTYEKSAETEATGYLDTGLSNETTYHYKVSAEDNAGAESGLSGEVSMVPIGKYTAPPLFGGTPTATTTAHVATIQWTTDRLSQSYVEYGTTTEYELGRVGSEELTTAHKVVIRGLSSETYFHYRVQSLDEGGSRNYPPEEAYSSDYTFETMKAPDITEVNVSDITLSSATISWVTTTISTSEIHYGVSMDYGASVTEESGAMTTNHTVRLNALLSGTTYHFKIVGRDADGVEIYSEDNLFNTIAYPRIINLRYQKMEREGQYGMQVDWETNVPTSANVRYYPRDDEAAVLDDMSSDMATVHSVFVTGLLDNTVYKMVVQGRDVYGNLAESEVTEFTTDIDTRPPVITKLVVETANQGVGKDAKAQIVVSWETNEVSTSQVEYGIGVGGQSYTSKSSEDGSLNNVHVIILSDLKPGTPYSIRAISKDAVGNTGYSLDYTVVTQIPGESVLDIILSTLRQNFGWIAEF